MSAETRVFYEFGKFRCDPCEHVLLRGQSGFAVAEIVLRSSSL